MPRKLDRWARYFNKVHQALFRATEGRLGGRMMGLDLVALTTIGRKSGQRRTSMVAAPIIASDKVVVVASYAAGSVNPQWYYNLLADPAVEVTFRGRTHSMTAHEAEGDERSTLWRVAAENGTLDRYQARTERRIPLIILEPTDKSAR